MRGVVKLCKGNGDCIALNAGLVTFRTLGGRVVLARKLSITQPLALRGRQILLQLCIPEGSELQMST